MQKRRVMPKHDRFVWEAMSIFGFLLQSRIQGDLSRVALAKRALKKMGLFVECRILRDGSSLLEASREYISTK